MADNEIEELTGMDAVYAIFGEPICVYTRAQALADGALVDVSEMAREAGIRFPVAISEALHRDIGDVPETHSYQSYTGRLWDCLWMLQCTIRGLISTQGDDQLMVYRLIMHVGEAEMYSVKAVCGPGDDGEPVITLMQVSES